MLHNVPHWNGLGPCLSLTDLDILVLWSNANDNRKRTWVSFWTLTVDKLKLFHLSTNFNFWIANFIGRMFMIPIAARFSPKQCIMVFGSLGASSLIFQTVFSGNPDYAWTIHVGALIMGSSYSGMMGLGISYGNEFTNMSGRYAMLTFIGMQFTGAVIVKATGILMKTYSYEWLVSSSFNKKLLTHLIQAFVRHTDTRHSPSNRFCRHHRDWQQVQSWRERPSRILRWQRGEGSTQSVVSLAYYCRPL